MKTVDIRFWGINLAFALSAFLNVATVDVAHAQSGTPQYPTKPIRLIVPFDPGSTPDTLARLIGIKLTEQWGQQVIVDTRAGAGGNIGTDIVAKAPRDGYTLLIANSSHAINPSLYGNLPFNPIKDFAPVSLLGTSPFLVVVNPSLPGSLRELIVLAKAKPGQLHYGSAGNGSPTHLMIELFKSMAGVNFVHVPYKGGGPLLNAILSNQVQITAGGLLGWMPQVKAGKLKGLAVTGSRRSPAAPEFPTVSEAGVLGYAATSWWGILAPAATQSSIVKKLNRELVRILQTADVRDRLTAGGIEATGNSPEEFAAFIQEEIARWAKVVKDSGARVD